MSSFASAALLAQHGFEPILQVTCRDRNRIALAGDLLGAAAQGIENLLLLRGDDPKGGDQPEAKPVFDFETANLMQLARDMRDQGKLPSGREIKPPPRFFIGAADSPIDPPHANEMPRLCPAVESLTPSIPSSSGPGSSSSVRLRKRSGPAISKSKPRSPSPAILLWGVIAFAVLMGGLIWWTQRPINLSATPPLD